MATGGTNDRGLSELVAARRNNYYLGKLLTVDDLIAEQRYGQSKRWLHNRVLLGRGVVSGLGVEPAGTADGAGVVVRPGLALDGWGREIVVPGDHQLCPLGVTGPGCVKLVICYSESLTDFVGDQAARVREGYTVQILEGAAPPATEPAVDDVVAQLRAGNLHAAVCLLARTDTPAPDDPCLTLANITVDASGGVTIDDCEPRLIAPTNRLLARLIGCLGPLL